MLFNQAGTIAHFLIKKNSQFYIAVYKKKLVVLRYGKDAHHTMYWIYIYHIKYIYNKYIYVCVYVRNYSFLLIKKVAVYMSIYIYIYYMYSIIYNLYIYI